jgi:type I restriction enzyme, S subunit
MTWPSIKFPDTIRKTAVGRKNQILSADIQPVGRFPVVDQGQAFIAGYSDAEARVIRDDLPLVIFGDHTRCLKYVDFPFILGADGTKVLKPKEDLFDEKFFYYALLNLDIPNRGYNRHFTVLKGKTVPRPERDEQRKIAGVLGVVQRSMEQQERLSALAAELKKALLHRLFTHGMRGESQKQSEIGSVPESWEESALEQVGDVVYGIQAAVAANLKPIGTKILTNKNITLEGQIVLSSINYFVLKTKRHHDTVLKKGDLLFNWRSGSKEHVGKTAYFDLDGEFTHSSFILRIRPQDEVTGRYLFYYLNFLRESGYFVKAQTFSINAKFNKSAINRLPMYLPREDERREIVTILDAVTKKIALLQTKRSLLEDLFRTMLHLLMNAQIRVHDLDLSELETTTYDICRDRNISEEITPCPHPANTKPSNPVFLLTRRKSAGRSCRERKRRDGGV